MEEDVDAVTHVELPLWQWMINYAKFQCAAQTLIEGTHPTSHDSFIKGKPVAKAPRFDMMITRLKEDQRKMNAS